MEFILELLTQKRRTAAFGGLKMVSYDDVMTCVCVYVMTHDLTFGWVPGATARHLASSSNLPR